MQTLLLDREQSVRFGMGEVSQARLNIEQNLERRSSRRELHPHLPLLLIGHGTPSEIRRRQRLHQI